jgi:hypothetical protein
VADIHALMRAIRGRWQFGAEGESNVVLPLRGGLGALVKRSVSRRLVSIADHSDAVAPAGGLAGRLEKLQARRSAIVIVPDRPSGVAIALRWGLNPEHLRLAGDFEVAAGDPRSVGPGRRRPWHSRG